MVKARRYIKDAILDAIHPDGSLASELRPVVSQRLGEELSIQRVCTYLALLYEEELLDRWEEDRVYRYRRR